MDSRQQVLSTHSMVYLGYLMSVVSHTIYTLSTAIILTNIYLPAYGLSGLIHYGRYNNIVF